ncbi:ComEC/Rec2 family competence protein [Mycolicibacterium sp. D5.8-2]|jgi:competence protein ComEC|uniref:ComEC/Rec2 family competence protein n=1 Tax=Mycolicibacterium sp. D5.8-2 TaxID=3085903 RepID=UPI00298CB154|nr:ComEC/Rec2 family competence protein [Mycolicibacterium sp. D5.8-2]MDW5612228.1 ComEC/Rec2 family competence protein [Mycolicibacterium sp. D5.8-2]
MDLRLVPAALTSWAVTAAGIVWLRAGAVAATLTAVAAAALIGWWAARRRFRGGADRRALASAVVAVAVVGSGFAVAVSLRVDAAAEHAITGYFGSDTSVVVTPSETPRVLDGGRTMIRGALVALAGAPSSGDVLVFASGAGYANLTAGQPAAFRARVSRPKRRDLTVAVLSAHGEPVPGEAAPIHRAAHRLRARFAESARLALPPDQAATLPALVLGDTSALSAQTTAEFRRSGLAHLTAVSGANVTIVCGAVLLSAVLIGPRAAVALAALTLVGFVVVVQPSPSVLRAAVMGAITLLAVLSHRRRQALPALAATVIALMIGVPELAVDVGFALSVSATAALVVLAPAWSRRLTGRGWPKSVADAVSVAVAAQLVTAPLVAGISGSVSVVAVLANLVVAPVIPPITVIGCAAAALCPLWPAGAELLIRFTGPEVWWLLGVARWAAGLPIAAVPVPSGAAGVLTVAIAAVAVAATWHWVVSHRRDTIVR